MNKTGSVRNRNFLRSSELVGEKFCSAAMLEARDNAWEAIERISKRIEPGMTERDAVKVSVEVMSSMGIKRHWHPPVIRMGSGTIKDYREPPSTDYQLKGDDIFLIDLGPVWQNGHEADVGATYCVGNNFELQACANDCKIIFQKTASLWREQKISGVELYQFANQLSENLGWDLMPMDAGGHRLADFPHKLHYEGNLKDQSFNPNPYLWVLEIQIRHPQKDFAAFYEDLLI